MCSNLSIVSWQVHAWLSADKVSFSGAVEVLPTVVGAVEPAQVGALTGELRVERPYRTFLTAVQFCEWKVSHLLQKPIESLCGFLTVLPGAFSAFRWVAVEVGLQMYFIQPHFPPRLRHIRKAFGVSTTVACNCCMQRPHQPSRLQAGCGCNAMATMPAFSDPPPRRRYLCYAASAG